MLRTLGHRLWPIRRIDTGEEGHRPHLMVGKRIAPGSSHHETDVMTTALPHFPHTSRLPQSGTVVSAPYRSAISAGSGSTWWRQSLHHTMSRKCAFAVLPSVAGGPGSYLIARATTALVRPFEQVPSALLLSVGAVLDLQPPDTRVVGIGEALRDDAFQVVGAHQFE